jgi:hypothetical protein
VTDVSDADIVLLGPEERHGIEALEQAEHVARGGLALALGHHPVFDAFRARSDAFAGSSGPLASTNRDALYHQSVRHYNVAFGRQQTSGSVHA